MPIPRSVSRNSAERGSAEQTSQRDRRRPVMFLLSLADLQPRHNRLARSIAHDEHRRLSFMKDKLFIAVRDRKGGDDYVTSVVLPAALGKQRGVGNAILLGAEHTVISRRHGIIERAGAGLVYRDTSTNGSRVNDQSVHRRAIALGPDFQIEIGPYLLSRIIADPFNLVLTDALRGELDRRDLHAGHGVGFRNLDGHAALTDLNRWSERERPHVAVFRLAGKVLQMTTDLAAGAAPAINKRPATRGSQTISTGDVIEHQGHRIEVLRPGAAYTVCGNPACQLLNPHSIEASCRWCGFHLQSTGAISRLVL